MELEKLAFPAWKISLGELAKLDPEACEGGEAGGALRSVGSGPVVGCWRAGHCGRIMAVDGEYVILKGSISY